LSFTIILFRKSQVYIFVKYLKLSVFEKVFGLNLNFEFKFKTAVRKLRKELYFSFRGPSQFGPCSLEAHLLFPDFFSFFRPGSATAHLSIPARLLAHLTFSFALLPQLMPLHCASRTVATACRRSSSLAPTS
jgi:hypothetical protein